MAIITNEVKEMDKITVNYLEMYMNHIDGYKQYKKEKAEMASRIQESDNSISAVQA
jgi:pyruvate-formate lyase